MSKPKIIVSVLTKEETRQPVFCETFLRFLFQRAELSPEFVGNYEPINNHVSTAAEAIAFCAQDLFWRRRHETILQGSLFHSRRERPGAIMLHAAFNECFDWFAWFRQLIVITSAYYGYLHLVTDDERQQSALSADDRQRFLFLGLFDHDLEGGLVEVGWANYLGAPWKAQANVIRLANEASRVEHLEGGLLFSVTNALTDVAENYRAFDERRQALKPALGGHCFRSPM